MVSSSIVNGHLPADMFLHLLGQEGMLVYRRLLPCRNTDMDSLEIDSSGCGDHSFNPMFRGRGRVVAIDKKLRCHRTQDWYGGL